MADHHLVGIVMQRGMDDPAQFKCDDRLRTLCQGPCCQNFTASDEGSGYPLCSVVGKERFQSCRDRTLLAGEAIGGSPRQACVAPKRRSRRQ